jgi:FG-GAP repeat
MRVIRWSLILGWTVIMGCLPVEAFTIPPQHADVDLANANPYFWVEGDMPNQSLGHAVTMGDINGDGFDDLVFSQPTASPYTGTEAGQVHILYGGDLRGQFILPGAPGRTRILGQVEGDRVGQSLAVADFNSDGFDDVAIGAPHVVRDDVPSDTVYIVWGSDNLPSLVRLGTRDTVMTRIINPRMDYMGSPVSVDLGRSLAAGNFDGDNYTDLIIGAPLWSYGQFGEEVGHVYVLYGAFNLSSASVIDMGTATAGVRTVMAGFFNQASSLPPLVGWALAAGDMDDDSYDDIAVGAPNWGPFDTSAGQGRTIVAYGRPRPASAITLDDDSATMTVEPTMTYGQDGRLGSAVAMGHFNSDPYADLLIGAPGDGFDDNVDGSAYIVRGQSFRPSSFYLDTTPGIDHAIYLGNSGLDELGASVALVDTSGDGLDDAIIGAPGDNITGDIGRFDCGTIYNCTSFDFLPFTATTLDASTLNAHAYMGRAQSDMFGRSLGAGDIDGDGFPEALMAAPAQPSGAANGEIVVFKSLAVPPQIVSATVVERGGINRVVDPGDLIILTFTGSVTLDPLLSFVSNTDWFLTNSGASLGSDAIITRSPSDSNSLVIRLGGGFSNLIVDGDDPSTSTSIDLAAIRTLSVYDPITGTLAVDNGIRGIDDEAIDLRWRYVGIGRTVGTAGGDVILRNNPNGGPIDFEFTRHRLSIPPGALSGTTAFTFQALSASFLDQEFTTGLRIATDAADPDNMFSIPATLVLEYRESDIDFEAGQIEGLVLPFQITPTGVEPLATTSSSGGVQACSVGAAAALQAMDEGVTQDGEENTVSVGLDGLNPAEGASPGTFATLPVNPVEERSIFLLAGSGGAAATATFVTTMGDVEPFIAPDTGSGYLLHSVEFPGYDTVTAVTPNRIEVKIRQATIFERTSGSPQAGANMFPTQSGALFIIETFDSGSSPIIFTDPVNISVQYIDRTGPTLTDIVDFSSVVGSPYQMRIVRSRVDTSLGPDFQHISATQSNSSSTGVVTATGVTNLTDADGQGAWGAIVDTSVSPPSVTRQDIIDHILGVTTLVGDEYDLADDDGNGVIDAADLVSFINP